MTSDKDLRVSVIALQMTLAFVLVAFFVMAALYFDSMIVESVEPDLEFRDPLPEL